MFVVDSSYSTSLSWFQHQLDFVRSIVENITVADERFNVSVITYSHRAYVDIAFGSYDNKPDLLEKIGNISYKNGTTNIKSACDAASSVLKNESNIAQYVYLLTDGMPTNLSEAKEGVTELRNQLRRAHISNELFIVAVGEDVRPEGLAGISDDRFFFTDIYTTLNSDALFKVYRRLVDSRCTGNAILWI